MRHAAPGDSQGNPASYEERVTIWKAESFESAIALAEEEAASYSTDVDAERIEIAQAYELFEPPAHGAEVFSLLRDSGLAAEAYVNRFFDTGDERQGQLTSS